MHEIKRPHLISLVGALVILLFSFAVSAAELLAVKSPPEFTLLTTREKPTCSKPNSICWLKQGEDEKFSIWFDATIDQTNNYRSISKVHIKNSKTSEVQSFDVPEMSRVELNDPVGLYRTQLRKDGPNDLVLFTNLSPHNGPLFYYFIYDSATKKFKMTNEEIPKLNFTNERNLFVSDTRSEIKYELAPSLELKQRFAPPSQDKGVKKVK